MKTANLPKRPRTARYSDERPTGSEPEAVQAPNRPGQRKDELSEGQPAASRGTARFRLDAPAAFSVKLAADFTSWDKRPIDLIREFEGPWQLTVELPPGRYAYRFLVDGEWADDPQCPEREPNSHGSFNSILVVL